MERGARWSTLFLSNGLFTLVLGVSFLAIFVFLVWPTRARPWPWMLSVLCNCLLSAWLNLAVLIIVGMLRFSEVGQACTDDASGQANHYHEDGRLILCVWITQLVLYPCMCCLGLCSVHSNLH